MTAPPVDLIEVTEVPQTQAIDDLAELVNPSVGIGLIGVYLTEDPGAGGMYAQHGEFMVPLGTAWKTGISGGMRQVPVKRYNAELRDLIIAGAIQPGWIVSKEIGFDESPDAYQRFTSVKQATQSPFSIPARQWKCAVCQRMPLRKSRRVRVSNSRNPTGPEE